MQTGCKKIILQVSEAGIWEEVLERFNKTNKKLQTPGFDVFEGYLLLASLLSFVKELQENSADMIAHYESEAKGLCENITSSYSQMLTNALL